MNAQAFRLQIYCIHLLLLLWWGHVGNRVQEGSPDIPPAQRHFKDPPRGITSYQAIEDIKSLQRVLGLH